MADVLAGTSFPRAATSTATAPRLLDRALLAALPAPRADAVLRAWLVALGAPPPPLRVLDELRAQLVDGRGARGEVACAGWWLVRQRDRIEAWPRDRVPTPVTPLELRWRGEAALPVAGGTLRLRPDAHGVSADWLAGAVMRVAPALSSQRLRVSPDGSSRTLKNLWQQAGVPVALRAALPAVSVAGSLLWAAPFGMDRGPAWPRAGTTVAFDWDCDDPDDPRSRWAARAGPGAAVPPL
jgi:tRNA(Ile)-lysidine synthase